MFAFRIVVALTMLQEPVSAGKAQPVSIGMRGIWGCVFVMGFIMAFSGETWTLNAGVAAIPALLTGMFALSMQQSHSSLPQTGFFPLGIGLVMWAICYLWASKFHTTIMSICCGLLFGIIAVLGVSVAGLTPYATMSLYAGLGGFLLGAFMGWCYAENPRFGFLKVALISAFLMAISAHAVITGCDVLAFFMTSVSNARSDPSYLGDARKSSILLLGEWVGAIALTFFGDAVIPPLLNSCGLGGNRSEAAKVATEEPVGAGVAVAEAATNETPLNA